jgi:exoribonuclease R
VAAASRPPAGERPAVLWTIDVDADGTTTDVQLERAMVRSRAQLAYREAQALLDEGGAPEAIALLPALGAALLDHARHRGAIDLGLPEQEVVADPLGSWHLTLRSELPVERWNAQVSLLTGRAAAWLMLEGGIGILRTVPAAPPEALERLRAAAASLAIAWPPGRHPGAVLESVDTSTATGAAFADLAAELLRGAAYTAFRGRALPDPGHAGVGAPYAHVTAPLRRLVDRFGTEACLALASGDPLPGWVDEALDALPEQMQGGDRRARALDRATVDATEAFLLQHRVGEAFAAQVVESGERSGTVVLADPPVRARCDGRLPLGAEIVVRCTEADVARRTVRFEAVA